MKYVFIALGAAAAYAFSQTAPGEAAVGALSNVASAIGDKVRCRCRCGRGLGRAVGRRALLPVRVTGAMDRLEGGARAACCRGR
jgi:hypothetical protein